MELLIKILVTFLEWMFVIGVVFSAFTFVMTTVEDIGVMFEKDAPESGTVGQFGPGSAP